MTRATRAIVWAAFLALAALQAYAHRFAIGPDGVSYLDLSDAVVTGEWTRLLNLYWSPLYPALIGIARLVSGAGPEHEIVAVHVVNVVAFAAMLAAFEYLLTSIRTIASRVRRSALGGRWGSVAAYAIFGVFAFTMLPQELTTPDILNAALTFAAFGAMLRLREDPRTTRHAIVFGASLGLAALAKSFMVPWTIICFATVAVALRPRPVRPLMIGGAVWLVFVLPWTAALSAKAGRLTFGDAGRLTYAWFVNGVDAPSEGGVPPGARRAATEQILPGVGVSFDTSYSNPMWADPVRWNASLVPHVRWQDQLKTMKVFHVFYVDNLAPLLFLVFLIAVVPHGSRRAVWRNGWIVYVPALGGLFAYAMVLVTSRYVMPFILSATLVLMAATPVARRLLPRQTAIGFAVPLALEALVPATLRSLQFMSAVVAGTLSAAVVRTRRAALWIPVAIIGAAIALIFLPTSFAGLLRFGAAAFVLLYCRAALAAVRSWRMVAFAERTYASLALLIAILLAYRVAARYDQDRAAFSYAASPNRGNLPWRIAQDLASAGIGPGTRIALIGPHAESYWVRTGRLHIVANVPRNRVAEFWALPKAEQERLLAEFAAHGATVAVATLGIPVLPPDSSWTPTKFRGRIRVLSAPDPLTRISHN